MWETATDMPEIVCAVLKEVALHIFTKQSRQVFLVYHWQ
jgi:hypothetical protein